MTASEDGTSDYNCVDVIREAGATIVAAAQSTTSLIPPLGNDAAGQPKSRHQQAIILTRMFTEMLGAHLRNPFSPRQRGMKWPQIPACQIRCCW